MTWHDLAHHILLRMSPDQRGTDVTIYINREDEAYPVLGLHVVESNSPLDGVLDKDHPYLEIE